MRISTIFQAYGIAVICVLFEIWFDLSYMFSFLVEYGDKHGTPAAWGVYFLTFVARVLLFLIIIINFIKFKEKRISKPALKNGDRIKITYLKPCRNAQGTKNPYIGMSGVVHDLTETDFSLLTETSWLVFIDLKTTKYEKL